MTTRNEPCTLVGCGCETTVYNDVGVEIHYCPTHAAAFELLEALQDILGAVKKARTMRAPAGHYDEDVYYNGVDFAAQLDIAAEIVAKATRNVLKGN